MINNKIFIDRDPVIFRYVIMYLRCGQQMPQLDSPFEKNMFAKEMEYWGLPEYDQVVKILYNIFDSVPNNINVTALAKWN